MDESQHFITDEEVFQVDANTKQKQRINPYHLPSTFRISPLCMQSMPKHLQHRINTDLGAPTLHDIPQFIMSNTNPTSQTDDVVFDGLEQDDQQDEKAENKENNLQNPNHAQTGDEMAPNYALRHQFFNELVGLLRPLSIASGDVVER